MGKCVRRVVFCSFQKIKTPTNRILISLRFNNEPGADLISADLFIFYQKLSQSTIKPISTTDHYHLNTKIYRYFIMSIRCLHEYKICSTFGSTLNHSSCFLVHIVFLEHWVSVTIVDRSGTLRGSLQTDDVLLLAKVYEIQYSSFSV